ncbi:hypothetical protein E8E13_010601 [Curvularia kusanoi]|uniref:WSC domain-containing protein n=1 Tax=Curvularia kusanoi TaxID=90978 RepID=A0A9P4WDQ5_CURKU|nr:hypothetical protein E8E13_010601 [Curvularia kusanoi]
MGFLRDDVGNRTLKDAFFQAGTEYGSAECYCGDAIGGPGSLDPNGAGCNMACSGASGEACGGPNRLSIYNRTTPAQPSAAVIIEDGTDHVWIGRGCYSDSTSARILSLGVAPQGGNQNNSAQSCTAECKRRSFTYAGTEYGAECYCGNTLSNNQGPKSDGCNMKCNVILHQFDANTNTGVNTDIYCYKIFRACLHIGINIFPFKFATSLIHSFCFISQRRCHDPYLFCTELSDVCCTKIGLVLRRCQKYGYMAGGMEYGNECYCGDLDHMVATDSQPAPETDCSTPCPGNPEALCGGGNRITWYKYTGDQPLYVFDYPQGAAAGRYEFLVGGPIIPLISQPLINGKVSLVEKHGTGAGNSTGAYEFDPSIGSDIFHAFREMQGLKTDVFCSSSLTLPDRAGRVINVGGWSADSLYGVRLFTPDGKLGVNGNNGWQENFQEISLQATRWYPTSLIMPNGSILVVGGENGSNGAPVPNMEILPKVGPLKFAQWLLDTDPNNLYPFLAVLPSGGIFVQYYNEARILDERTLDTIRILPKTPATVNSDTGGRTYPMEGSMMLLPQSAPYTDPLEVLICGGAGADPGPVWGIDNCITTQPDAPNPVWTIERMPSRRVLTCMTTLPDGTFMIMNGAEEGVAGFGLANVPNLNALIYDSRKPKHHRISVMANTTIARMYHSEAVLLDDGRVLVSGSDPQDNNRPQEYRVEVFIPPYLTSGKPRPSFTIDNKDWANGGTYAFTVTSSSSNIRVSILGSEASTHGNSMGARILYPAFQCGGSSCTVTAPPGPYVAPAGWYRMFVLADDIPSHATWVRIGGDPGQLGNWPNVADFKPLPGVGPVNGLSSQRSASQNATARKFRA